MKYLFLLLLLGAVPLCAKSQTVFGVTGASFSGNNGTIEFTLGEVFTDEHTSTNSGVYEGFHHVRWEDVRECPYDLNADLVVNSGDLLIFIAETGCTLQCAYDFNGDLVVNSGDLLMFLSAFSTTCVSN